MQKKIRSVAIYVVCSSLITLATDALAVETGLASYYADKFQGRKTASGERYDKNRLTAAHRTLPLGSQIQITNLKNKNSVIVTINDRGPYHGKRKLDLSYAAARELGLIDIGVASVSYELVAPKKNNDFEQIIPHEYTPGVLEVAQSEEEQIEAEEELVNSDPDLANTVTADPVKESVTEVSPPHHNHSAKKHTHTEKFVHREKKHSAKSDKQTLKVLHKNKSKK